MMEKSTKRCPICSTLLLDRSPTGIEQSLQYVVQPDQSDIDFYIEQCDPCRVISDLGQHWSGLYRTNVNNRKYYIANASDLHIYLDQGRSFIDILFF